MATHPGKRSTPSVRRHQRPESPDVPDSFPAPGEALTRERMLETALAMIDAEGVDALSMRRLGQALHRDPMRLYRHADSKSALLDMLTELVLTDFVVPMPIDGDWQGALRVAAHRFRGIALAHPKMVPLLVTRPLATPLGLRPAGTLRSLEQLLELFIGAGFESRPALHGYRLFIGFLHGHVLNEVQELVRDPEENDALLRLGLHVLPRDQFPRMRELASELAGYDGAVELEEGLDTILIGLSGLLEATEHHPPKRGHTS